MPRKPQFTRKDAYLLIIGVLLAFMVQLFYDSFREAQTYQNLIPMRYWNVILAAVVAIFAVWLLKKFDERKEP